MEVYTKNGNKLLGPRGKEEETIGRFIHDNAAAIVQRVAGKMPQTVVHADFRGGNLMRFKAADKADECIVLDWQTYW